MKKLKNIYFLRFTYIKINDINCIQDVSKSDTQVRLGKDSIDNKDYVVVEKDNGSIQERQQVVVEKDNR